MVNWGFGGKFDFISATVGALHLLTPAATKYIYVVPWHTWVREAAWLLIPAIAFVAGIALVVAKRESLARIWEAPSSAARDDGATLLVLSIGLIVSAAAFLLMQALQFSVLALFFRANALLPFVYLAFGSFIAVALSGKSRRVVVGFSVAAAVIFLAPWLLGYLNVIALPLPADVYTSLFTGVVRESLWILAGGTLLLCAVLIPSRIIALVLLTFVAILNVATLAPGGSIRLPQDVADRDRTLATFAASKFIDQEFNHVPAIWWDHTDPEAPTFASLGIMYLDQGPAATLAKGDRVVFIRTSGFQDLLALSPFSDHPLPLTGVLRCHVQRGTTAFDLIIGTVK